MPHHTLDGLCSAFRSHRCASCASSHPGCSLTTLLSSTLSSWVKSEKFLLRNLGVPVRILGQVRNQWHSFVCIVSKCLTCVFFMVFLRVSTVSQSTAWTMQRHSSPQLCGWVRSYLFFNYFFIYFTIDTDYPTSCLTHDCCCFPAYHAPGTLDIHCNQPCECLHQGRKQTPGGEFVSSLREPSHVMRHTVYKLHKV